jgi:hypothetical protein
MTSSTHTSPTARKAWYVSRRRTPAGGPRQDIRAVAVNFHGGYGDPVYWKQIKFLPDTATEGDTLVGVPALARGLAYASFNLAGWDDKGKFTARMLERAGFARHEDPPEFVDPKTGRLGYGAPPLKKGDVVSAETTSVARDLIRAAKQVVIAVAGAAGLDGADPSAPDDLPALILGYSWGGYLTSAIVLGVNPIRPASRTAGTASTPPIRRRRPSLPARYPWRRPQTSSSPIRMRRCRRAADRTRPLRRQSAPG